MADAADGHGSVSSASHGAGTIELDDGAVLTVRTIRTTDADGVRAAFEKRMSPETRYRRFLSGIRELDDSLLQYLTDVDHRDHEALVAVAGDGRGVAVARYVRSQTERTVAEMAMTVVDEWQGRGLGTRLLALLAQRARAQGVTSFTALMLSGNRAMRHLLEGLGPLRVIESVSDTVRVQVALDGARD